MVFAPQRRHAVASFSTTLQALALMQHLYAPNTIVLICRIVSQMNIRTPPTIHPGRSLFLVFFIVTISNAAAALFHLLDYAGGSDGKGIFLDFVGQANPASLTRILLLDLAIYAIQVITCVVFYINSQAGKLPKSDEFPYDDLLLPPGGPATSIAKADVDVETGDQFRRKRVGKGPRYQPVSTSDSGDMWAEDSTENAEDEDPLLGNTLRPRTMSFNAQPRGRRSDVPLIFRLTLSHLISLILRLPAPDPPRIFAGSTPLSTPPVTPRRSAQASPPNRTTPSALVAALANAQARVEARQASEVQSLAAGPLQPRDQGAINELDDGSRNAEGARPRVGPTGWIPGDYWTTRPTQ